MAVKPPPTATAILATPIDNVEESRAQRLQRQQSRFRDRGGIFIPSSRNTLADILLGKMSPIKKPRRSASLSPSKDGRKLNTAKPKSLVREMSVHEQDLRRSPRKQGRTSSIASPAWGPKPVSKISSHSSSKAPAYSPKPSSLTREPTNVSDEVDVDPALVKGPSGKKTLASRQKLNTPKAKASRLTKEAAENHEENEPRPKRTATADEMNGHELKPSETVSSVASSSKASSSARTRNPKKTPRNIQSDDEEYGGGGATKTRRKKSAAPKSQPSSSNRKSSSVPSKPSKSRPGAPQLPDIIEEDEDDALPPSRLSSPNNESTKIRVESTTTKKRQAIDEDPLADPDDRPRKRVKPARRGATAKQSKANATPKPRIASDEESSAVERKRRRSIEQDEDTDAEGKAGKPAKRKKVVFESEKVDKSPLKPKKSVAKPSSKSAPNARKPTAKKAPTKTAKRKENYVAPQSTQFETPLGPVPPRRGLPKSILLRLQNSSAPHVVDDEPDPIDFLS